MAIVHIDHLKYLVNILLILVIRYYFLWICTLYNVYFKAFMRFFNSAGFAKCKWLRVYTPLHLLIYYFVDLVRHTHTVNTHFFGSALFIYFYFAHQSQSYG